MNAPDRTEGVSAPSATETPSAKVAPARRLVLTAPDLKVAAEGKLIALRAIGWGMHTFKDDEEPSRVAEIVAFDLSGTEPVALGVVEITWTYIVRQLQISPPDVWQIGVLTLNADKSNRVELAPPPETVDLKQVAAMLGRLTLTAPPAEQPALPAYEQPELPFDEEEDADSDIPF